MQEDFIYNFVESGEIPSAYISYCIKRKRTKKLQKKLFAVAFVILFLLFLIILYFKNVVSPLAISYGSSQVERMLVKSCNTAILNASTINYDDVVKISYGANGQISSIVADSTLINNIANSLATKAQTEIDQNATLGVSIPIGTMSGISILSGKGSNVNFSVNPLGNVVCHFHTTFESAGINQTSHKIFVTIKADATLILPFNTTSISKSIDYLLCECLIIGNVPNTYLQIGSLNLN